MLLSTSSHCLQVRSPSLAAAVDILLTTLEHPGEADGRLE